MKFDFETLSTRDRNKLMLSTVMPRPIALTTTLNRDGLVNAAPFSYFQAVTPKPPLLMIAVQTNLGGGAKDTAANIRATGDFVVNMVSYTMAAAMNICAIDFPPETSEIDAADFTLSASEKVKPPRIAESPIAFECRRHSAIEVGPGHQLILGEIVCLHVQDSFISDAEKMHIAGDKLDLIGRMHGSGWYARTTDLFEMKRLSRDAFDKRA